MQEETCAISKELTTVEGELNSCRMKYRSIFNESLDNPDTTEGHIHELSAINSITYVDIIFLLNRVTKVGKKR